MKLWLDDLREPPHPDWEWCRTPEEFTLMLAEYWNTVTEVSLDHDLGLPEPQNGYRVLCWIEEQVVEHNRPQCFGINIHTANPVAHAKMWMVLQHLDAFKVQKARNEQQYVDTK